MTTDYALAVELLDGPGVDFGDGSSWARLVATYRDKNKLLRTQAEYDAAYAVYQSQQATFAAAQAARQTRLAAKKTAMKSAYNGSTYVSLNTAQKAQFREDFILFLAEREGWLDANGVITIPNGT